MTLLLDTQVFLWTIAIPAKLSKRAAAAMRDTENDLILSSASLWEIALKFHAGKLDVPATRDYFDARMSDIGIRRVLDISPSHVYTTLRLPRIHKDPFDKILAAQCVIENMQLVSADPIFRKYPIQSVW